jgi:ABC-type lipoprotein export system ATPase subunit
MNSVGSIWRKWDLHIDTPASFHWKGKQLEQQDAKERAATCKAIIEKTNKLDIDAFCVMDYWTFDGYGAVREYEAQNPGSMQKRIFPGVELRLEAPADYRLNTHVLFDDAIPLETLWHFLSRLAIGSMSGKPPSRQTFIDLGKSYDAGKLRLHGYAPEDKNDEEKMHCLGMQTAVITRESLEHALQLVGDNAYILIQPYDTSDGLKDLDWKRHPYSDSYLMKLADMFETRDQGNVDLFLGLGHAAKPSVAEEFIHNLGGEPKPVVSGSDAHSIEKYGEYPSNRITWLKAQPTFAGLRQVCHEPALRCFIGPMPPKQEHLAQNPTKYIKRLQISKTPDATLSDSWFDGTEIDINPGLIAIIGNKGTGKSALADILGLAGNTHCPDLEFLNAKRFRKGTNIAKYFIATLTWADGKGVEVPLDRDPDKEQPERVRYLPQQFIETLCNEIETGGGNFEQELKKVIFSHVPEDRQLQKASLDDLIGYTVEAPRNATSQLHTKLHSLNAEILRTERELSEETIKSLRTALSLKEVELEAHDKARPTEVAEPTDEAQTAAEKRAAAELEVAQTRLVELQNQLTPLKAERTALVARNALLDRLTGHLDNLEKEFRSFSQRTEGDFVQAGISLADVATLVIDRTPLSNGRTQTRDRLAEITLLLSGSDKQDGREGSEKVKGLESEVEEITKRISRLQSDLGARQREYQAHLAAHKKWENRRLEIEGTPEKPETIKFLTAHIKAAEETLPQALETLKEQRKQIVRDVHAELLKIRAVYQELYKPVQDMIVSSSAFTKEPLQLDFDAFLAPAHFENEFLDYIHRNKVGNFYGEEESKKAVEKLLAARDFNSTDDAVAFLDDVMGALTTFARGGAVEVLSIQSQLKGTKKIEDLYDFLFGLRYLEPRYALKLGEKDISQLSPGEKGALLLVFYLLLDPEEIPIIIDQPEQNLDNESVVKLLVDCIRQARARRQVIIVTHNPNLAVVCDADQVICCHLDKLNGNKVSYDFGAIEDNPINRMTVDVLEGTYRAFDNRRRKYHKPH